MKNRSFGWIAALLIFFSVSERAVGAPSASERWLERRWEIRYVLFAGDALNMQNRTTQSRKFNKEQEVRGRKKNYLSARALFEPAYALSVPDARSIGVALLTFDSGGHITNQNGALDKMSAKVSRLYELDLVPSGMDAPNSYHFAYWTQGIPGDVTFSPAVCSSDDKRRYVAGWNVDSYIGSFGCREWTAQLYNRDQPYIDVTSYASHGTFIGDLLGWSRFEDPLKPVIGRHGKVWLCLHECPRGDKPGVIPNIRAWTARHGFPMPVRPSKQPLYPNVDYMDDLNEFAQ